MFITLLNFLVLIHYIRFFWILLKEPSNSVNCFLRRVQFSLYQGFLGFLFTLLLFLILRASSPDSDMISVNCLTVFLIALVLLDDSKSNLSFPNFSWVSFWFSKDWNKTALWSYHLCLSVVENFSFSKFNKTTLENSSHWRMLGIKVEWKNFEIYIFHKRPTQN